MCPGLSKYYGGSGGFFLPEMFSRRGKVVSTVLYLPEASCRYYRQI
jgi:hypothetical protein